MKKILVDTNIFIDYLRRKDKANSLFFQIFSQKKYSAVISLTTVTELWAGKSMSKKQVFKKVSEIIDRCELVLPEMKTAKRAGEILRQANYEVAFQDAQIAALALENKLLILTLNQKDFRKIKALKFFRLESFKPSKS